MQQVLQHAEERRPSFMEEAQSFVLDYLREHGPTSGEVLTVACKQACVVPHDDRAFGAVYMGLRRRGLIHRVGECKRLRGHNTGGGSIYAAV
jgi:hypothetical protein